MWAVLNLMVHVSGFHSGCFSYVWSPAWSRHSSSSLKDVKSTYVQSLLILVLLRLRQYIYFAKEISQEKYSELAKVKDELNFKAVVGWKKKTTRLEVGDNQSLKS